MQTIIDNARRLTLTLVSAACLSGLSYAQSQSGGAVVSGGDDNVNLQYSGSRFSIGVGVDTEFDVVGEITGVFTEDYKSALIGEGWVGSEGAGGLKLNYHWLLGATAVGEDGSGNPIYGDGTVAKAFVAVDQGEISDHRKLTFGGGFEKENYFFSLYGVAGLSGEELVNTTFTSVDQLVNGAINGRGFNRIDTINTTTQFFEEVYEWGLGIRGGTYIYDPQLRLTLGADFEDGRDGADQFTASARLDKVFGRTGHMLSLRGAWARKSGPFEVDRTDWRGGIFYTYRFGETHRPVAVYESQQFEVTPAVSARPSELEGNVFRNQVDVSNETNFELDKFELQTPAKGVLNDLLARIQEARLVGAIKLTGHTCNLGTDEYNLTLSENRVTEVQQYLLSQGLSEDQIEIDWKGESDPRYSNETEATRRLNRRVEIEFITETEVRRPATGPTEPVLEWRQVEVPVEAPWIRRALRTPVRHKRRVDVYRTQETTTEVVEGQTVFDNQAPALQDDAFTVNEDSADNSLSVLANDSDPDGDGLQIITTSTPGNGVVNIAGDQVVYTPNAGFTGSDSFTYTVDDGFGGQQSANVVVTVIPENPLPIAVNDSATANAGQTISIDVLANDSDPEGEAISLVSVDQPSNGSAQVSGSQVSYTADAGFSGTDTFSYTIADEAGNQATAQVSVTVTPGSPPVAVNDSFMLMMNVVSTLDVLANDSDPDGDALTLDSIDQQPTNGTASINADGTIAYRPPFQFRGMDQLTYTISDTQGNTATATVNIMIGPGD